MTDTTDKMLLDAVIASFNEISESESLNLLQVLCLGNPEKTIQGEILNQLRTKNWKAVQEVRYKSRSIDILILDDEGNASCTIEIKHYSANQGSAKKGLFPEMHKDFKKIRPTTKILQIGVYTSVDELSNVVGMEKYVTDHRIYRFIKTYCLRRLHPIFDFLSDANQFIDNVKGDISESHIEVMNNSFTIGGNNRGNTYQVYGKVGIIIYMAHSNS